jgi:hypothetical protein
MKRVSIRLSFILICSIFLIQSSCEKSESTSYFSLIESGEFTAARTEINKILESNSSLSDSARQNLLFEMERMDRIEKDFDKSPEDVVEFIRTYIPNVGDKDISRWEAEKSLEYMMIDGQKRYFDRAARNLFRIDKSCRNIWAEKHPAQNNNRKFNLDGHIREIMNAVEKEGNRYVKPIRMRILYTITVDENVVPPDETIRCWIPFPREIKDRQGNITFLESEPAQNQIADNRNLQRTVYLEKKSIKDEKTVFSVQYEYTGFGSYIKIDPDKVVPVDPNGDLKPYLKEEYPHIVFTEDLKTLSRKIVGEEKNPYRTARLLYAWIDKNIPWASAREYSTIRNIPQYCYENGHGDCGIKSLLFITLLRMNGIPARWQSGWEFQPPDHNMHDWGMAYFDPYGWVPIDVDYGLRKTDDPDLKWFYLSGMDSYRLIFNDNISQKFEPPKKFTRSETVDSQRGELEWSGGNLYYDQWDWDMDFKIVSS